MKTAIHTRVSSYTLLDGSDFIQNYEFGERELGRSNARVFEAKSRVDLSRSAIKEINLSDESDKPAILKEIELLRKIDEKDQRNFFVKFIDFCIIREDLDDFNSRVIAYILMEKAAYSLTKLIESRRKNPYTVSYFSLDEILKVFRFLIDAFAFLQKDLNIAHCDIKPENLLIMKHNELEFKICDVGAGEILMSDQHTKTKTIKGTIPFLAPELSSESLLTKKLCNPFKADVFSLGLCFLYIITFRKFSKNDRQTLNDEVFAEIIAEWVAESYAITNCEDLRALLREMLEIDPKNRPDFKELQERWGLAFGPKSPTTVSEDMTNPNSRIWTLNDEGLTNSFVVQGDELISPERNRKKVIIKKKTTTNDNRFKSLHQFPENVVSNTTSANSNPSNNTTKASQREAFKTEGQREMIAGLAVTEENAVLPMNLRKTMPNKGSLSPVKAFRQPAKKGSIDGPISEIPLLEKQRVGMDPMGKSQSHSILNPFSQHMKENEEAKSPESVKKSSFSKKNSMMNAGLRPEPVIVSKRAHQKIVSNASEIIRTGNAQFFTPKETHFPSIVYSKNETSKIEQHFMSNKDPNFFKDSLRNDVGFFSTKVGFHRESHYTGKNEGKEPLILKELAGVADISPPRNKKSRGKNLPPLSFQLESPLSKTLNLSMFRGAHETDNSQSFLVNETPRKEEDFLESEGRFLIVNKQTLDHFAHRNEARTRDRNLSLVLDHRVDEKETLGILSSLRSFQGLKSLTVDLCLSESVTQMLMFYLGDLIELESLVIIHRVRLRKTESPLKYGPQVNSAVNPISFDALNKAFKALPKLKDFELHLERISEVSGSIQGLFKGGSCLSLEGIRLSLRSVALTNSDLLAMLDDLSQIETLGTLDLSLESNLLDEQVFGNGLKIPPNLRRLSMNCSLNQRMSFAESKVLALPLPSSLESLSLEFEGVVLANFPALFRAEILKPKALKSLQLNFADSKLQSSGFQDFIADLAKCKALESLGLSLKNNNLTISETCIKTLGKAITSNFGLLKCLELNFLNIEVSLATIRNFLNFENYLCSLKLEFFNLSIFRNATQKTIRDSISALNANARLDVCVVYPELKEMKVLVKIIREREPVLLHNGLKCPFLEIGATPRPQKAFSCLQCFGPKYFHDHTICLTCVKECHMNHRVFYFGERSMTCACFNSGGCKNAFEDEVCTAKISEGEKMQLIY